MARSLNCFLEKVCVHHVPEVLGYLPDFKVACGSVRLPDSLSSESTDSDEPVIGFDPQISLRIGVSHLLFILMNLKESYWEMHTSKS
jgi:hypothetical protein